MSARQTLAALNAASREVFVAALAGVFEHSAWVAEAVAGQRPFATLADLRSTMMAAVEAIDETRKLELLRLHPDLAGKAAQAGTMTYHSKAEHSSARLDGLSPAEFQKFQTLNADYVGKFGFPFIVCVRRHTRDSIFREFESRLKNNRKQEYVTALAEISRIASLRLDQIVDTEDGLGLNGRLDIHITDNIRGGPAANVAVELREIFALTGQDAAVSKAATDTGGMAALISGKPVPIGTYELRVAAGTYFKKTDDTLPFIGTIPIRVSLNDPEATHSLRIAITPWSYAVSREA
jgi:2-oxo-4-hydroxy-4-carboxy-5-ureidoimidazoline decarboxylase